MQRCKSGGHECVFEESNRGKRSTRKNEALAAKVAKMEAALRSIGGVGTLSACNVLTLMTTGTEQPRPGQPKWLLYGPAFSDQ